MGGRIEERGTLSTAAAAAIGRERRRVAQDGLERAMEKGEFFKELKWTMGGLILKMGGSIMPL